MLTGINISRWIHSKLQIGFLTALRAIDGHSDTVTTVGGVFDGSKFELAFNAAHGSDGGSERSSDSRRSCPDSLPSLISSLVSYTTHLLVSFGQLSHVHEFGSIIYSTRSMSMLHFSRPPPTSSVLVNTIDCGWMFPNPFAPKPVSVSVL